MWGRGDAAGLWVGPNRQIAISGTSGYMTAGRCCPGEGVSYAWASLLLFLSHRWLRLLASGKYGTLASSIQTIKDFLPG